jgi:DNA polymerase-4
VTLKLRYADFTTITRSETRTPATRSVEEIASRADALLQKTEASSRPVRLLGVSLHGLCEKPTEPDPPKPTPQLDLPVE